MSGKILLKYRRHFSIGIWIEIAAILNNLFKMSKISMFGSFYVILSVSFRCVLLPSPSFKNVLNLRIHWKHDHWRIQGGARDARPPGGPNSFIFMQILAKF